MPIQVVSEVFFQCLVPLLFFFQKSDKKRVLNGKFHQIEW